MVFYSQWMVTLVIYVLARTVWCRMSKSNGYNYNRTFYDSHYYWSLDNNFETGRLYLIYVYTSKLSSELL